jgi:hypothetical protein
MRHALLALFLPAALAGCGDIVSASLGPGGVTAIEGGTGGGGPTSSPAILHGSWLRTVSFYGTDGSLHLSETRWTFEQGGAAVRVVTTANLTFGFSDATITTARWRVEGAALVLEFLAPAAGTARFTWRVQELTGGTQLLLDDLVFQQVPR